MRQTFVQHNNNICMYIKMRSIRTGIGHRNCVYLWIEERQTLAKAHWLQCNCIAHSTTSIVIWERAQDELCRTAYLAYGTTTGTFTVCNAIGGSFRSQLCFIIYRAHISSMFGNEKTKIIIEMRLFIHSTLPWTPGSDAFLSQKLLFYCYQLRSGIAWKKLSEMCAKQKVRARPHTR